MAFSTASAPVLTSTVFFANFPGVMALSRSAERDVTLVGQHVEAGVQEAVELTPDGLDHARGAVAGVEAADATGEIDEAVAVDVFDDGTFSLVDEDRRGMEGCADYGGVTAAHEFVRAGAGDGSA